MERELLNMISNELSFDKEKMSEYVNLYKRTSNIYNKTNSVLHKKLNDFQEIKCSTSNANLKLNR